MSSGVNRPDETRGWVSEAVKAAASEQETSRLPLVSGPRMLSRLEEQIARVNALSWSLLNPELGQDTTVTTNPAKSLHNS